MMRYIASALLLILAGSAAFGASVTDALGVVRVFGDQGSSMSAAFVVGDGSWVVTTLESITEKVGPDVSQINRFPIFVSSYTGQAWQCELTAQSKDLNLAVLKLPVSGLPAAPLAQVSEFSKAAFGTLGQLMSGDPMGNNWPTDLHGITREKAGTTYRLGLGQWVASKIFITDIGNYKWAFASEIKPDTPVPNGAMVTRGSSAVGMYLNKMTFVGGKEDVVYGRVLMSTEIARFMGDRGVDTTKLYTPPAPTAVRDESAASAFQIQALIYSYLGARRLEAAIEPAKALVKMRPKEAQAQMVLGLALTGGGKLEEALKAFDEAVKINPKLPTLRTSRALALIGLKKNEEAEAELLKAVDESPTDVRPVTALAEFYMADEKSLDKGLSYAQKASRMATNSPAAQLLLARAHRVRKDYKAATTVIGEAIKMAPEWYDAWFALGVTCEEAGDKASAEKAYRKLVEKQPKNPDALLTLAAFLADQGQKDEPLELIGKVRDLKPPKAVIDAAQAIEDKVGGKKPEGEGK